jgi:DnaD/phage-associated family protein
MKPFVGFSSDRHKTVRVPEGFFEDLLPAVNSMLEMKVTLFMLWRLARGASGAANPANTSTGGEAGADRPYPRMVSLEELESDERLRAALAQCKGPRPFAEALREGLELAVARGTLLEVHVRAGGVGSTYQSDRDRGGTAKEHGQQGASARWYLLNTRDNRAWLEAVAGGKIDVTRTPLAAGHGGHNGGTGPGDRSKSRSLRVVVERPSIYTLYEQNIGLLTPLLAERLQDAEARYPLEWIEQAFEEAVANNKRSWRYIERILERWAAEGKHSGQDRRRAERALDPDKYTKGKYAFLFRPEGR